MMHEITGYAKGSGGRPDLAVVLFQLGGPDSPEAVEHFLYNLFSDPDIIDFPFARLARPTLARLVASRRAWHVQEHYARIGGASPIRERTEQQAGALEAELRRALDARVFVAMRYWHPLTEDAARRAAAAGCRELVLLPLYPQYSKTTTGSSLNEWQRQLADHGGRFSALRNLRTGIVPHFYDHPGYLGAIVEKINEALSLFQAPATGTHLVFSAHGVPLSVIEAGDPYQAQVEATVSLVMERGGWSNPHHLCYQSRVSPGKWLEPSLRGTLRRLGNARAKRVLVVPIAFVCDHVETLYEIDIEARAVALECGIRHFEVMPALNDSPTFIRALADLVLERVRARPAAASMP